MTSDAFSATKAQHLTDSYAKSVESLDLVIQDLDELQESIGPETASKLRSSYEATGGEQFLQDTTQLQCERDLTPVYETSFSYPF